MGTSAYETLVKSLSPSLYWDLQDNGATDLSGNGRNGTGGGGISIGGYADGPPIGGASDTSTDGDGTDDRITATGYAPYVNGTVRTFLGWANRDVTTDLHWLFGWSGDNCGLRADTGNENVDFTPSTGSMITWTDAWPGTGQWVFWAVVLDETANTAELFINGETEGEQTSAWAWHATLGGDGANWPMLVFGPQFAAWGWDGKQAHFAVIEGELTAQQIADLYDYAINGSPPALAVRESPPCRLHVQVTTPGGRTQRWGGDERRSENIPSDISFSTVMPGGFEAFDCTLPRKPDLAYQDQVRLSEIKVFGAGGEPAWEGRLEKTPRVAGEENTVNPQAVGWQAHLEDNSGATFLGVDRDLTHWGETSRTRKEALYAAPNNFDQVSGPSVDPDAATGIPALRLISTPAAGASAVVESLYDAGGGEAIASIYADWTSSVPAAAGAASIGVASTDAFAASENTADLIDADPDADTTTFTPTVDYRYGWLYFSMTTAHGGDDDHWVNFRRLTVWGNHGLTKQGTAPNDGLYASDVIAYVVGRWCPLLNYTTGANGTIKPSAFIIPQLEFRVATTAAEILKQANRFSLDDWWVDFDRTFNYAPRDSHGRRWRARVAPAQLEETGPSVDRLWNGVIVTYQDVDGSTKTVGPTGAGTDSESDTLLDTDSLSPVNQLGMKRYTVLDMGIVSTATAATEVGRQFLERSKELDQSGSAQIVGHCEDNHGVMHPAWKVRAGDQISFVDSSDTSYRRVVKTSYDHDARTCSIDLDAPPEGMEALLERLSVSQYTAALPAITPEGWGPGHRPQVGV